MNKRVIKEIKKKYKSLYPLGIVGVFLYGSYNYGTYFSSEKINILCITEKCSDTTYHNGEIRFLDLRSFIKALKEQDLIATEALFTDYYVLNRKYKKLWAELREERENIVKYYNPYNLLNNYVNLAKENYNNQAKNKENLYTLCRIYFLLSSFVIGGKPYSEILKPDFYKQQVLLRFRLGYGRDKDSPKLTESETRELIEIYYSGIGILMRTYLLIKEEVSIVEEKQHVHAVNVLNSIEYNM